MCIRDSVPPAVALQGQGASGAQPGTAHAFPLAAHLPRVFAAQGGPGHALRGLHALHAPVDGQHLAGFRGVVGRVGVPEILARSRIRKRHHAGGIDSVSYTHLDVYKRQR